MLETFDGLSPSIADESFVHEMACIRGEVELNGPSLVLSSAAIIGDYGKISIGHYCTIEECCVLHAGAYAQWAKGEKLNLDIGNDVIIAHGAVVHCRSVGDNVMIGMNSTILEGAEIGSGSVIAAGAVVPEYAKIPPNSFVAGVPAVVKREISAEQSKWTTLTPEQKNRYFDEKIRKLKESACS